MASKVIAAIVSLVALLLVDAKAADVRVPYSGIQYLKNFALSVCITEGYISDEVVKDSRAAADGYLQLGSFPFAAYEEAASLSKKFRAKKYLSFTGDELTLMKCIDLFHSNELDRMAKKYDRM
jgi:hypothetical protein